MGRSKGCGKLGRMLPRDEPLNAYHSAILCSPVVSVWDCIFLSMDNKGGNKVQPVVRKAKKKQVKDELDRIKQAEKKKRRLEKALATSAAIRSELEKKKQKKKEEQQRLDEDSAAIAEAVALHVLLGEDSGDSGEIMLNKEVGLNRWDCASNFNLFVGGGGGWLPHQANTNCEGWVTNAYGGGSEWSAFGNGGWSFTYGVCGRDLHASCFENKGWGNDVLSADLIAAQAVSALQIREDTEVEAVVLNRMLRG
ncbi:transcription initiation factor TFIID subunit 13-like [Hibiscus syriacus]|uniref:Transcription initiation factor TFIID subunit 13-like n=2 Tax=Hibiscus syriacus TaxID=106335 RepID=A0A6A3CWE7_HIBSY|nr:transcription initiation factor TFIID subunit 13-like [Hibiscus syriacus]